MLYKRNSDGKIYPDIQKAVTDFKPEGSCSSSCPLFAPTQIQDSTGYFIPVHKCRPQYIREHEHEIAKLLGLTQIPTAQMDISKPYQYNVVIKIQGRQTQKIPCNSLNGAISIINQRMFNHMLVHRDTLTLEDNTHNGKISNPNCVKHKTFSPDIEIYIEEK